MTDFQKDLDASFAKGKAQAETYEAEISKAAALYSKVTAPDFAKCIASLVLLNPTRSIDANTDCIYTTNKLVKAEVTTPGVNNIPDVYGCKVPADATVASYFSIEHVNNKLFQTLFAFKKDFFSGKLTDGLKTYVFETDEPKLSELAVFNLNSEARDLFFIHAASSMDIDTIATEEAFKLEYTKGYELLDDIQSIIGCLDMVGATSIAYVPTP